MTELINDKADCRTAPATPGLLITDLKLKIVNYPKSIYLVDYP